MQTIRSSEIASYLYCPACWWRERIEGVKITPNIVRGELHHRQIASNHMRARSLYIALMVMAGLFAIFLILWGLRWLG